MRRKSCLLAVLATVAAAAALRWAMDPLIGTSAQYAPFALAVVVITVLRGRRAGLLATALGGLAGMALFVHLGHLRAEGWQAELARLGLFFCLGVILSLLVGWLVEVRDRAAAQAGQLAEVAGSLRQSEALYQAIARNLPEGGVFVVDRELRCLVAEGNMLNRLGMTRECMEGRSCQVIPDARMRQAVEERFRRALAGETASYETDHSGHVIWAQYVPLRNEAGDAVAAMALVQDITARKRAEEALAATKGELERASAAKDHFLAVLSHELRTPLAPVMAAVAMLQGKPALDEEVREGLEVIRRNVEMEARLIDDLLDVTRISRGKIELDRKPVQLCQVLRRAMEVVQADIETRCLHVTVDTERCPCIVNADAARLQQVFWNLLRNAVKFTPCGGRMGIRCRREGDVAVVEVSDSGIGIGPDVLPRLFNAFEQAERSITRQFGGLGLGLAISKTLVELHGGSIEARSDGKGRGATFRVCLPLAVAEPQAEAPPAPPPVRRALRILLAEDHADTARMMHLLLMGDGHEVERAGDVVTALELAARGTFDLLISDLGLPDRSGLELMQELRARGCAVPGIAVSGYGQQEDISRSQEAGFAMHLTKPTTAGRLAEAIASVTAGSSQPEKGP